MPTLILGNGAFALRIWIRKPYRDILSEEKHDFNYRRSMVRMVTEGTFDRLKSRFTVLYKKCESDKLTVKAMTLTFVVSHNICIERGYLIPRVFDLN